MKRTYIILILVMCLGLAACAQQSVTTSLEDYLKTDVPLIMEITLFPDRDALDESAVDTYVCSSQSTLMFDDIYFLLCCTYDEADFAAEIVRFEGLGARYQEDLFQMPAWVMHFGGDYYEYALIDKKTGQIVYVAAQTPSLENFEDFPEEYLPVSDIVETINLREE